MNFYLVFVISCIHYTTVKGQFDDCQTRETCTECISSGPRCSWCEDIIYQSGEKTSYHKKCDTLANHMKQGCKKISNPESESIIVESSPLGGTTRVFPKKVAVKLRPGQATTVEVKVKTPKNFPIDLYYLMDLSLSMKDDLSQIQQLGAILSEKMSKVTSSFRLGFGGFVDKPLGPYTRTKPEEIKTIEEKNDAVYTFAFRNYLPLTGDTSLFEATLKNVSISFNVDVPESTLEALMQVLVCDKAIGWQGKQDARRIVIITTDANFHMAGDGLLGGLVTPNDGACHLKNNEYDAWRYFDYPSLSQIRAIMIENQITPIFATTGNTTELYNRVAKFFGPASGAVADQLNEDSTNVVPLIKEAYEKIAKVVSINADAPKQVDVKYTTICGVNREPQNENFCNDVAIGQTVTFKVDLTAKDCSLPKDTSFKIKTSFDDIDVQLELLCDCPCAENKTATVYNSSDCSSRGDLSCGQCQCDPVYYAGRFCQCTVEEAKNQTLCLRPDSNLICSGQGRCECGECRCQPPQINQNNELEYFYGDQCECTNTSCGRIGGLLCGGPDRGRCDCGNCICNKAWQGPTCSIECIDSTVACIDRKGVLCSGRAECECNECKCPKGFTGQFCEECVKNCPDPCQDYKECVRCRVLKTSDLTDKQCENECQRWNITSHIVKEKISEDEKRCISRDDDDCSFVFTYNKDNVTNDVQLIVQQERICPAEPDILAIILGVIAGIIGIGLALLLIWKLLATIQDRRDFAKFEKDRQNPKWDSGENPIYKEAISTFQNPTYGNKD